jgi:hypothetical protein
LKEIGQAFGANDASVLYRIRKFGITYEKIIWDQERDEEKRRVFMKFVSKNK